MKDSCKNLHQQAFQDCLWNFWYWPCLKFLCRSRSAAQEQGLGVWMAQLPLGFRHWKTLRKDWLGIAKTPTRVRFLESLLTEDQQYGQQGQVKREACVECMLQQQESRQISFCMSWFRSSMKSLEAFEQECHATCSVCVVCSLDRKLAIQNSNLVLLISRIGNFNHSASKCVRNTRRKRQFVHKHVRASCFRVERRVKGWHWMIWVQTRWAVPDIYIYIWIGL